jgi:hypothetical protein
MFFYSGYFTPGPGALFAPLAVGKQKKLTIFIGVKSCLAFVPG